MKLLVVKIGTEALMERGSLAPNLFAQVAQQIIQLQRVGIQALVVSSGAIQAGRERIPELEIGRNPNTLSTKSLASIGARVLLNHWSSAFDPVTEVGQLPVTSRNWKDDGERKSIKTELEILLENGLIPIVNENDIVSNEEIRNYKLGLGENDQLARMVAELMGAEGVLFLTSVGGVYEVDPATNPHAKKLKVLDASMIERLSLFGSSITGRGGMEVKVREALLCAGMGMRVAITGLTEDSILRFGIGENIETMIV